jgi:hypothetical protein
LIDVMRNPTSSVPSDEQILMLVEKTQVLLADADRVLEEALAVLRQSKALVDAISSNPTLAD